MDGNRAETAGSVLGNRFFGFLVLVAQYESCKLPLAIVLIVPMWLLACVTA